MKNFIVSSYIVAPKRTGRGTVAATLLILAYLGPNAPAGETQEVRAARALLRERNYEKSAVAFAELVKTNPYDGALWRNLGFSLHPQKRYDEAIAAWKSAIDRGDSPANNWYNIACAYSLSGRTKDAVDALRTSLELGFVEDETIREDTDMNPIRDDPEFRRLTGLNPPGGLSRDEKWRYDLDFFSRRMEQMHWDLYAKVSKNDFQASVRQLKEDVPRLTDDQILVRLRRILATVGDGHTLLVRRPSDTTVSRYPLDLYVFSDGLFVRGAPAELESLIGAKVLRFGDVEAPAAMEKIQPYASVDNPMGYRYWTPTLLTTPAILEAIGSATDALSASLHVQTPKGETIRRELKPAPLDPKLVNTFGIDGFRRVNADSAAQPPLYQRNPDKNLWFEYLPQAKLVYFHFREIDDQPDLTLKDCVSQVLECLEKNQAERLVIDMRLNGGGDTGLTPPLIHGLIRCNRLQREDSLFVIIGRRTFSAAMNTVSVIEHHLDPVFVGEPTGSSPNFVGESTTFTLPYSGYPVSCSSRYWQHVVSLDKRIWIAPDIVAELSSKDYAENRDPAMDAILAYLARLDAVQPAAGP